MLTTQGEALDMGFAELTEEGHTCPDCGEPLMVAGEECEECGWVPPLVRDSLAIESEQEAMLDVIEGLHTEFND